MQLARLQSLQVALEICHQIQVLLLLPCILPQKVPKLVIYHLVVIVHDHVRRLQRHHTALDHRHVHQGVAVQIGKLSSVSIE